FNRDRLAEYELVATGATGDLLRDKVGLEVEAVTPGPHGGDVQIASRVVEGEVDAVIFLVDPLDKHPHDPDIQTLLRICNVRNVPLATNIATAHVGVDEASGARRLQLPGDRQQVARRFRGPALDREAIAARIEADRKPVAVATGPASERGGGGDGRGAQDDPSDTHLESGIDI